MKYTSSMSKIARESDLEIKLIASLRKATQVKLEL